MQPSMLSVAQLWRQNLRVAIGFWGVCLVLVALEVASGSHIVVGVLFFISIPILVGYLTWVNKDIATALSDRVTSLVLLGVSVLASATVILLVGLLAAAKLKGLMMGV